jgi:UDP-glucose 4-epimerase
MNILITGGAGFIGSHLARHLLAGGHTVHLLDNLSTGRRENVAELLGLRCRLQVQSVGEALSNFAWLAGYDQVYHLAAAVGVKLIVESPVDTIETNVHGTEMVLKVASKKKKKVLIASTSEVYGKSEAVPFREAADLVLGATTKGRWSYACSKAIDEFLALAYWKEKQLPVVVFRLFNTVGPRQTGRYGMVIPNFVKQALSGAPITVYGDGRQSRCFTYVSDVVEALVKLAEHPDAVGQVLNIGNDREEISILDLAQRVKARTGSKSPIEMVAYDKAYEEGFEDMPRRVPDLGKIRALLGYEPRVHLDEILDNVAEYFRTDRARV